MTAPLRSPLQTRVEAAWPVRRTEVQGTAAWFAMVGTLMVEAAAHLGLPEDLSVSLLERYTDGTELSPGYVQGIRFDVVAGAASFRAGVHAAEGAEIEVEVTSSAARQLNDTRSDDPAYVALRDRLEQAGELRLRGDPTPLAELLGVVHDPIVDRTRSGGVLTRDREVGQAAPSR